MKKLDEKLKDFLMQGTVIPAHPLALTEERELDEAAQRRLSRYYMASGAGGIAVAVHSTQFEIRDPKIDLLERVLTLASEEIDKANLNRPFLKIAGICGPTEQAVAEAQLAASLGYDLGLLSMGGLQTWSEEALLDRVRAVAEEIPVFGFYLQPSVGGRVFSFDFWRKFIDIKGVEAIKCASFNRYQTLDVMRALAMSSRQQEVAMYTGNDDNIVADLLTDYRFHLEGQEVVLAFKGGLLGHWAVWTRRAVELLKEIKKVKKEGSKEDFARLLSKGIEVTDSNATFFDPAHDFAGCIPGIHEVLRRQGLLRGIWCLNPQETLSPGQYEEISRVYKDYSELNDDPFVTEFLDQDPLY